MKKKVIVAGNICLDITPMFPDRKVEKVTDIMLPGKLIEMGSADIHTGGAVANTGLAMKLLGADVSLVAKIGKDAFGDIISEILKKYNTQEGLIVADGEATSYSVVLAMPGIDRIFLHNPGANHTLRTDDIPEKAFDEASLLHFGYPPVMRSMYEDDGNELIKLMKKAKDKGISTSLDLAAVDDNSEAGKADWKKILTEVIPYVDFFVPSAEELCYMMDRKRFDSWLERAGERDITEILDVEKDIKPLADICMSCGAKVVLIKCGAKGMYYRTAGRKALQTVGGGIELAPAGWADKEGFEKSFVPEKILSGTGAGDTSIAAFLTAMLEGSAVEECVRLAAAEGASCVTAFDALGGIRTLDELRSKIASGWKKMLAEE